MTLVSPGSNFVPLVPSYLSYPAAAVGSRARESSAWRADETNDPTFPISSLLPPSPSFFPSSFVL